MHGNDLGHTLFVVESQLGFLRNGARKVEKLHESLVSFS